MHGTKNELFENPPKTQRNIYRKINPKVKAMLKNKTLTRSNDPQKFENSFFKSVEIEPKPLKNPKKITPAGVRTNFGKILVSLTRQNTVISTKLKWRQNIFKPQNKPHAQKNELPENTTIYTKSSSNHNN